MANVPLAAMLWSKGTCFGGHGVPGRRYPGNAGKAPIVAEDLHLSGDLQAACDLKRIGRCKIERSTNLRGRLHNRRRQLDRQEIGFREEGLVGSQRVSVTLAQRSHAAFQPAQRPSRRVTNGITGYAAFDEMARDP
jgi:hypothetical protein